jgi:hypothetical protein
VSRSWSSVTLITGVPRTGTTAIARALVAPDVAYLHEPLNPLLGMRSGPDEFLVPHADDPAHADLLRVIDLDYRPQGPRMIGTRGTRAASSYVRTRLSSAEHLVLKDPTQPFLLLAGGAALGLPVVAMIRHPETVLASYRSVGISPQHGMRRLLDQGEQLRSWGIELDTSETSDAAAVGLLWRAVAEMAAHPAIDALVVKHEDLIAAPTRVAARVSAHTGRRLDTARVTSGGPSGRSTSLTAAWSSIRRQSLRGVNPHTDAITDRDRSQLAEALQGIHHRHYGADG